VSEHTDGEALLYGYLPKVVKTKLAQTRTRWNMALKLRVAANRMAICGRKLPLIWLGLLYGFEAGLSNSRSGFHRGPHGASRSGMRGWDRSHLLGRRLPFPGTYLYVSPSHNYRWANAEKRVEAGVRGENAARTTPTKSGSGAPINKIAGNAEPKARASIRARFGEPGSEIDRPIAVFARIGSRLLTGLPQSGYGRAIHKFCERKFEARQRCPELA
jgi:hypothetical protein